MNAGRLSTTKVFGAATIVMVPLVAAAWLPQGFPHLLRQILLCVWGVGAILVAERLLFSDAVSTALHSLGFVPTGRVAVFVAIVTSLPMWSFLPFFASIRGDVVHLRADWIELVAGVVLVNGITEEVLHRGFVFGHLRRYRSFATAASSSALLFAVQHLYIVVTNGWTIGGASVVLAALIAYPMAFAFERGGNSIVPPAILHASANAPVLVFELPDDVMVTALVSHMGVILVALYVMPLVLRSPSMEVRGSDVVEKMSMEMGCDVSMSFPNEPADYRTARNALLESEVALRRQMEAVAAQLRALPPGGAVPEDYLFDAVDDEGGATTIRMSELFRGGDTLMMYHYMFPRHSEDERAGPIAGAAAKLPLADGPCPSCTALIDMWEGTMPHFEGLGGNLVIVARAPIARVADFARDKGWKHTRLVSAANNTFRRDYGGDGADGEPVPIMTVFKRWPDGVVRLHWASELIHEPPEANQDPRHLGTVEPLWTLFDLTPGGRPAGNEQMDYQCCQSPDGR